MRSSKEVRQTEEKWSNILKIFIFLVILSNTFVFGQQTPSPYCTINDQWDFLGSSIGWNFAGADVTVTVGYIVYPVQCIGPEVPTLYWSNPTNWDNIIVYYDRIKTLYDAVTDPANISIIEYDLKNQSVNYAFQDFWGMGPTETPVTFAIPLQEFGIPATVNLGTEVQFEVTLDGNRYVILDQDSILRSLMINNSASLVFESDRTLTLRQDSINFGTMVIDGYLVCESPLSTYGSFDWINGSIKGKLFNMGNDFILRGLNEKRIEPDSTLTNMGFISQDGDSTLTMCGYSWWGGNSQVLIDNKEGSIYNLLGDGNILLGIVETIDGPFQATASNNLIQNQGIFRKSGGTGESIIEAMFNNENTLEVNNGILTFKGGGTFTDSFTTVDNDAELKVGSNLKMYGDNHFSGTGTVFIDNGGGFQLGSDTTIHGTTPFMVNGGQIAGQGVDSLFAPDTSIELLSGSVGEGDGIAIGGSFDWFGGSIKGKLFNVGSDFMLTGSDEKRIEPYSTLTNMGLINQTGESILTMCGFHSWSGNWSSSIDNKEGATYSLLGDGDISLGIVETIDGPYMATASNNFIQNQGTFRKSSGIGESVIEARFVNDGILQVDSGTLAFTGGFTQNSGTTILNGGNIKSTTPFNIIGGTVEGTGEIVANILNEAGFFSPGFSPGVLTIDGDYTQGSNGTLLIEIAGLNPELYDMLNVTGTACLDGLLDIKLLNGFTPQVGDTFEILNFGSYTGIFSSINGLNIGDGKYFEVQYLENGISLNTEVIPAPGALLLVSIGVGFLFGLKNRGSL